MRGEAERASAIHHRDRRAGHPLHSRPLETPNALPLIVTHGWPGSIIEQMKIIEPLTNPTAHGGSAADAFDVVIPSIPGYGFSGKPTATGWDPAHRTCLGRADEAPWLHELCGARRRLGCARHRADGPAAARSCSAFTPTCRAPFRPRLTGRPPGAPAPAGLSADESTRRTA